MRKELEEVMDDEVEKSIFLPWIDEDRHELFWWHFLHHDVVVPFFSCRCVVPCFRVTNKRT